MATRNSAKIIGSIGVALAVGAATSQASDRPAPSSQAAQLAADNEASQAALLRGDVDTFIAKIGGLTRDFVLMSPMGAILQ